MVQRGPAVTVLEERPGGYVIGGNVDSREAGAGRIRILQEYTRGRSRVCLAFESEKAMTQSGQIQIGMIIDVRLDVVDRAYVILMVPELPPGSTLPDTVKQLVLNLDGTLVTSGYIKLDTGERIRAYPHPDLEFAREEMDWLDHTFRALSEKNAEIIPVPDYLLPHQSRAF